MGSFESPGEEAHPSLLILSARSGPKKYSDSPISGSSSLALLRAFAVPALSTQHSRLRQDHNLRPDLLLVKKRTTKSSTTAARNATTKLPPSPPPASSPDTR